MIDGYGLRIEHATFGEHFQTACYVISASDGGAGAGAVVVDPGRGAAAWVEERLAATGRSLACVLLTHGHMDHTWDVWPLVEGSTVPVVVHRSDQRFLRAPQDALPSRFPGALLDGHPRKQPPVLQDLPSAVVEHAGIAVRALHTPGHTPGSACYLLGPDRAVLVTGDTLLAHGPGALVEPVGDEELLRESLAMVAGFADVRLILPGHGVAFRRGG